MAFKGKRVEIFGSFKSKKRAMSSERANAGAFIRRRKIRGQVRYVVMRRRKNES